MTSIIIVAAGYLALVAKFGAVGLAAVVIHIGIMGVASWSFK